MYSTLAKERQQRQTLGKEAPGLSSQDLPLFQYSREQVSNLPQLLIRLKSKSLEQLLYEIAHYRRNYYRANALGKQVLRLQLRKLSAQILKLST